MPAELHRLIRALGLVWRRLGSARFYLAAIALVIVGLAAIGLWHLLVPLKRTASSLSVPVSKTTPAPTSDHRPPASASSPSPPSSILNSPSSPSSAPPSVVPELERQVAIIDATQREERGRHGETFVIATIGLASRTNVEKSGVEIHVYFYDLTANNEMRPTDAQVTYQWLTPVRDWSDPAPKYLAATYFKPPVRQRSFERLRYGGFVVRVLSDGKLQDERSQPEGLIAQLRNNAPPTSRRSLGEDGSPSSILNSPSSPAITPTPSIAPAASSTPAIAAASPSIPSAALRSPTSDVRPPPSANRASSPTFSPTSDLRSPTSDSTLPYGKPIPGKPGFLYSPYDSKFIIDVRGFPPGTLVNDPNTNKPFRVP